MNIGFLVKI